MTMHWDVSRDAWLGNGVWLDDSPPFPPWHDIALVVVHWPGANGVPHHGDDPADVFDYLRSQQSMYVNDPNRGYNLGYSCAVDYLGRRIEVRGDGSRNAANAPADLNAMSLSIEVLTNLDGAMTDAQIASVADIAGQVCGHNPDAVVIAHRDGPMYVDGATPTACPGDDIYARLLDGQFDPQPSEPGEPDMPLTDDDVNRIADAVWRRTIALKTGEPGEVRPAGDLLGWTHANAEQANEQIQAHRTATGD